MADDSESGGGQTSISHEERYARPPLDGGYPSDELALYEGLEQLGRSSEQYQTSAQPGSLSRERYDSGDHAADSTPSNELIDVDSGTSPTEEQGLPCRQTAHRDELGLPSQRPAPPQPASSPDQNEPSTELDMYVEQSQRQTRGDETQDEVEDEVRSRESSRHTLQTAPSESAGEGTNAPETELDAYEALRRSGDEPLRGGGAGPSAPYHHNQQPNPGRRASSTTSGMNNPSNISTEDSSAHEPPERSGRNNPIVLPRWQPDAEVTYCPICSTQFSFFNRKHHCRKCGRVVCATCSQHRITIPHEFIVHPPIETSRNRRRSLSQSDTEAASTTCGGTKVRLCNPCVPDPNTLPPPPIRSPDRERPPDRPTYLLSGYGQNQYRITEEALNEFEAMGNQPSSVSPQRQPTVSYSIPVVHRAPFPESRFPQRTSYQHIRNTSYTGPHFTSPHAQPQSYSQSYGAPPPYMPSNTSRPPSQPRRAIYNSGLLNPSIRPHQGQIVHSLLNPDAPPPPPPPRPEILEEDRCPICREDLVMIAETEKLRRGRSGAAEAWSDTEAAQVREKHVDDCFKEQASILSGRGRHQQSISESSQLASPTADESAGPSSRPRAPRRVYGLFPFAATEKDCIDDAECAICFEDFTPGAKMARLECFCRFHEACIRGWWEKKPGMCPVHGHNMEGL